MKTIGGMIDNLLREIHDVINDICGKLGSDFGMDEVIAPIRLEAIITTVIPVAPESLADILKTIESNIFHDTGVEVDLLRKPLRTLQAAFHRLDLDQYLQPVKDEAMIEDWPQHEDDDIYNTFSDAICERIEDQMAHVHDQRKFFIEALENANRSSHQKRSDMERETSEALEHLSMPTKATVTEEWLQEAISATFQERSFYDLDQRTTFYQRIRGFLFTILGGRALGVFTGLDKCVEYARLKDDETNR